MQALILAAGMGKRLGELTQSNTKCMVEVNGVTLIDRMLHQLERLQLTRIVVVVGYEGKKLVDYIGTLGMRTPIYYVVNPIYDRTNNIYSLGLAKRYLVQEDTLLLESDLIFEDAVLQVLLEDPRETLALVDRYESWMDGSCMKLGEGDVIEAFVPGKSVVFAESAQYYKTVNIYKFGREFARTRYVPFLEAYMKALGNNEYYEQVLRVITMLEDPEIRAKKLDGQRWYEIDDIQDLDIASSMFGLDEREQAERIQARYGGYWRYPFLLDFCYLVNPCFPPKRLMEEMKAGFEMLLTRYPSGMRVNSLLAARNFGVRQEHILVGNGAAELIKALMELLSGRCGLIRPAFEEYFRRYSGESITYVPQNEDFSYGAGDLMEFFDGKGIGNLVLINPDNPSGNYIRKKEVLRLALWCEERRIRLVVDESFVDFAEEKDGTLIEEPVMERHRNLVIIKSVSKSYGVPGLRLGVLVSADEELVADMKKAAPIWNINSFGEFYMQIAEKYKKDYEDGLERFKELRKEFADGLGEIPGLRVVPSQANYLLVELTNGMAAKELTEILLHRHRILIKDLTAKPQMNGRQFVRVAVRSREDNRELTEALRQNIL